MILLINQMLELAESGIKDVENALGPPGMANPYNLPEAAAILGTYAVLFKAPQKNSTHWQKPWTRLERVCVLRDNCGRTYVVLEAHHAKFSPRGDKNSGQPNLHHLRDRGFKANLEQQNQNSEAREHLDGRCMFDRL
jgi:hypothetical protein